MSEMPGKCYFQSSWLKRPEFREWLENVPGDPNSAKCRLCVGKIFSVGSLGATAVCGMLLNSKRLVADDIDELEKEFKAFLEEVVDGNTSEFKEFRPEDDRVDELLYKFMATDRTFVKLWGLVQKLLLISHGQASVERGFSTNKQVERDNLAENSHVALRTICDYVNHVGGIANVLIDKDLLSVATHI